MSIEDIPSPELHEYEEAGTVHEIYNFGHESIEDITEFLRDNNPDIDAEGYFVRVSYIDENGIEQWIQSDLWDIDDIDSWYEDIADDMEAYGLSGFGGVSVGYVGMA